MADDYPFLQWQQNASDRIDISVQIVAAISLTPKAL